MSRRYNVEAMNAYNEYGKDGGMDAGSTDTGSKKRRAYNLLL